jgi:prevent-host-death family protein
MPTVNIHEAKTQFSRLIERVGAGEEIIIAKSGKPVARLLRFQERTARRKLGLMAGQFSVPDDFDSIGADEIERMFEGAAS